MLSGWAIEMGKPKLKRANAKRITAGTRRHELIKYVSLVVLVVQNTSIVLLIRYTRTYPAGKRYIPSTVVALSETMKLAIAVCVVLLTHEKGVAAGASAIRVRMAARSSLLDPMPRCVAACWAAPNDSVRRARVTTPPARCTSSSSGQTL